MKYKQLNDLKVDGQIDIARDNIIYEVYTRTPKLVFKQFYADHSSNDYFVDMYGHIDLLSIEWKLKEVTVVELGEVMKNATFVDDLNDQIPKDNNHQTFVNGSPEITNYWKKNGTWDTPPVLISGELLGKANIKYHLVEGNTRLGCLFRLSQGGQFQLANKHQIFYWRIQLANATK